jgi:bifunctional non-homologous end joining protein LigD
MTRDTQVTIKNRRLELSNLDKVFYPEAGLSKGDVIDYYRAVAPVLLPHLKGRPVTLKRFPNGAAGSYFYEKQCPSHRPKWIRTVALKRKRDDVDVHYCRLDDEAALVWSANLANLELHTSLARARNVERPTSIVFDLDPGEPAGILECADIALRLREAFEGLGLESFVKTSGSKGLQLYVPLNTAIGYEDTNPFAQALARKLEEETPDLVVSRPKKADRTGKVFVDWSQNNRHKTTVCVYSLRARPRPTVSTPVTWDEVRRALKKDQAEALVFEYDELLTRVKRRGDLFEPVDTLKQKLPKL